MLQPPSFDQVLRALQASFPAGPPTVALTCGYLNPDEAEDIAAFEGRLWIEVASEEFLSQHHRVLLLFTDEAKRYRSEEHTSELQSQ